jgi:prepilin-type processing-associated H-X9-DG protein
MMNVTSATGATARWVAVSAIVGLCVMAAAFLLWVDAAPVSAAEAKAQSAPAPSGAQDDARLRAMCQNNLKQLGLVFKMFANESKGQLFPELSPQAGHLFFSNENGPDKTNVYPEYLSDLNILVCPATVNPASQSNRKALQDTKLLDDGSYFYLGYVVTSDEEVKAFAGAYNERIKKGLKFDQDLDAPEGSGSWKSNKFYFRLREGIERFGITDINNPAGAALVQSQIPILIERAGHHKPEGGNVLFMDGHVTFLKYPGTWPMTETTMSILTDLSKSKAPAK